MLYQLLFALILTFSLNAAPVEMNLPFGECEAATNAGRRKLTNYLKCRSEIKVLCSTNESIKKCTKKSQCAVPQKNARWFMKKPPNESSSFQRMSTLASDLRDPDGGCPWDQKQH